MENENDGKITLTFLHDNLEVQGDFFPSMENGSPISGEYIRDLLEKSNIVYGIQHDEIHKAYTECVDGEIVSNVLIARGDPPVSEVPEYLQLNPHLIRKTEHEEVEGKVDHRARSPFIIVKKDQLLAKLKHTKPGKEGTSVCGEPIAFQIASPTGVFGGENTRMEGRLLLSNINGQLLVIKSHVHVRDRLIIKGSVDYATGNIIFPGNVEIHGTVSDGFKIYAGGSVIIKQTFDVTDAIIKKNLHVAGGIIGRGQAMVKVGGNIKTRFIENCRVACRKGIYVEFGIVNSNVFTMESLETGDRGRIVGGEIYAFKGICAGGIGRKTGKAAKIHCGVDFALEQEKEKNNGIIKMLAIKISRLKELMDDPEATEEKKKKMEALLNKLLDEQRKAQAKVSELLGKANAYADATVVVKGEIVPGSLIEICQAALFVTEALNNVKIRLDQESNKLIIEKL